MQATSIENYYDLLQIDRNASQTEVKKAYFSKIREYPNETHPVEFQKLTKAYKILMDPEERKKYDQGLNDNGSYAESLESAINLMNQGYYNEALLLLEEMLDIYTDDLNIQQNIAICYINQENFYLAKQLLQSLESNHPEHELTVELLGNTYTHLNMHHQAKTYFQRLVILNPQEPNYFISLAMAHFHLEDYDQAIDSLQQKLNQEKATVFDFPLLENLFFITMIADRRTQHRRVIQQIKQLYTTDKEKEQLLYMLIRLIEGIETNNNGYKELVNLVKDINSNEDPEINEWLIDAESLIQEDLIYYGDTDHQTQYHSPTVSPSTHEYEDDGRGSIAFSIILGIIVSFFLTPIGGIIAGFIWYFNAPALKKFIGQLGCFILVIIFVGFILFNL